MKGHIIDMQEYSVCEDCLFYIAYGESDRERDLSEDLERLKRGRRGYFVTGVQPTECDPDGRGYVEFRYLDCELCRSGLGGSRHGVSFLVCEG